MVFVYEMRWSQCSTRELLPLSRRSTPKHGSWPPPGLASSGSCSEFFLQPDDPPWCPDVEPDERGGFDRFQRSLRQLLSKDPQWDGTLNGMKRRSTNRSTTTHQIYF
ncbi:hypothetical protein BC834DRAFT_111336 [Gloeopeniophorella convolvens]|nr:hypothetical protein BC834DRAFT_111336 [Gloeopeniophorella convolvens]